MHAIQATIISFLVIALAPSGAVAAAPCWEPPVPGPVVLDFVAPECPYCTGHRGVEYDVGPGTPVISVAAGAVTWAGSVAGTRYVVVTDARGWRLTYGKLASSTLKIGDVVARGTRIGTGAGLFYFGLRLGEDYLDPSPYLGALVGRPRLVPVDGAAPRAAPAPRPRCPAGLVTGGAGHGVR